MIRKLLIIQPSHYLSPGNPVPHKTRRRFVIPLTLPYLAALEILNCRKINKKVNSSMKMVAALATPS